jgi:uncharacterized protein
VDKAVIYIHGKGGNAEEAIHYKPFFSNCDVIGLDYTAQFPWEAKEEFPLLFNSIYRNYKTVEVIANSIGAYFAINALSNQQIEKAYFISPVVDMERLIADMMIWANVTEDELKEKKEIQTTFGETLSWDYLCYARENPIIWEIPTHILYGEKDNLTAYGTIFEFVQRTNSTLSIMKNGEHWFHTDEQMKFLDEWIIKSSESIHICKLPSRYNLAYSKGSSTANEVSAHSDPYVVFKSFSAPQQSMRSIYPTLV